jgi:hypothetical protein
MLVNLIIALMALGALARIYGASRVNRGFRRFLRWLCGESLINVAAFSFVAVIAALIG